MTRSLGCFLLVFSLGLTAPAARAWNPTGHMVASAIAYRQLPPDVRQRLSAILDKHPDAAKWRQELPAGADPAEYAFMRASVWPDEIRRSKNPFDHPEWHYVDYPLKPPGFPLEPAKPDTEDVLSGIAACQKMIAEPLNPPEARAAHLAWLLHLVADVHQPLHCAEFINATYPADEGGDRGGNRFFVLFANNPVNLHFVWDSLPGNLHNDPAGVGREADRLVAKFPRAALPELVKATDARAWSLEGRAAALEHAYRRGTLPGSPRPDGAPPLPPDYYQAAKAVAEKRLALGAYRLADSLRALRAP